MRRLRWSRRVEPGKKDGLFGIAINYVPQDAMRRAGSTWARGNSASWLSAEPRRGELAASDNRSRSRLNQLFTITDMVRLPGWVEKKNGLAADPESARAFARWTAEHYGPRAGAFELRTTGPDMLKPSGVSRGEAAANLAALYRVFHPEIARTGKPLLLNVSGEGIGFAPRSVPPRRRLDRRAGFPPLHVSALPRPAGRLLLRPRRRQGARPA